MKITHTLPLCLVVYGACSAPDVWKLPSQSLRYAAATSTEGPLRIGLLPVSGVTWQTRATPESLRRWQRRLAYVRYVRLDDRDLYLPLVPLPSIEVTLVNDGDVPITLDRSDITVTDSEKRTYAIASSVKEYLGDLLDPMVATSFSPLLWLTKLHYGSTIEWPAAFTQEHAMVERDGFGAARALVAAAEKVPLLGPSVVVAPHSTWVGALVLRRDARSLEEVSDITRSSVYVSLRGMRAGDVELPQQVFTLPMTAQAKEVSCANGDATEDPAQCRPDVFLTPVDDGPCMERNDDRARHAEGERIWVDGTRVTHTGALEVLVATPESRRDAKTAAVLRGAGSALIAAGTASAAATIGGLIGTGHESVSPAGLGFLAVTAVGAGLNYLGYKKEMNATREFNRSVYESGACAAPR